VTTAYIGIGSNLGDREAHLALARQDLGVLPRTRLTSFSGVYETAPVGPSGQGLYLNAAAELETSLDPVALFGHLQQIERRAGRERRRRWEARTLDLDVLLYGGLVVRTTDLEVPHPRLHQRWFALRPLCDLAPDLVHPVLGRSLQQILSDLPTP